MRALRTIDCMVLGAVLAAPHLTAQGYATQIQTWVAQDALNPPPHDALLFVGSSTIRRWENLARDFAEYDVIQRGFGGSQFPDLNNYVQQIVLPYDPLAIVVFEGTNDTAGGAMAPQVFQTYLQFVQLVHSGQNQGRPPIPIFFIGITPTPSRWSIWPVQSQVNQLVQNHAATDPSLHYIDVPTPFLATGQPPSTSLFVGDNLHLNTAGYALFSSTIHAAVAAVVPSPRVYVANPLHPAVGERLWLDLGPSNPQDGNPTASPDPNGNHWNNWHAVNGGVGILAGQSLGNLVTTSGSPSGIDFVITGGFLGKGILDGGLLAPSPALLGQFAVATATQDYFFTADEDSPGGFALLGLDPLDEYALRFFGTRNAPQRQVSRYTVTTASGPLASADLQTSGVGAGVTGNGAGNDDDIAQIPRLQPDAFGQLFVDVDRLSGMPAYIGILEVVVTDRIAELGPGCGVGPPRLAINHPRIGAGWHFEGRELQAGAFTVLAFSFGQPAPTPLPLPGCTAYVDLAAANFVALQTGSASATGTWSGSIVVPAVPGLDGTVVTVQLGALTVSGLGFELSNGLRATLRN